MKTYGWEKAIILPLWTKKWGYKIAIMKSTLFNKKINFYFKPKLLSLGFQYKDYSFYVTPYNKCEFNV